MKWVLKSPGQYKLVDDDDPRPEVNLPSKAGAPNVHTPPSWAKYEAGMHHPDPKIQDDASEKFLMARADEMRRDPAAKRREESRKQSVMKDKPAWRKDNLHKMEQQRRQEAKKIVESL